MLSPSAGQLYNLKADPGEAKNVIAAHPEVAKSLQEQLQQLVDAGGIRE